MVCHGGGQYRFSTTVMFCQIDVIKVVEGVQGGEPGAIYLFFAIFEEVVDSVRNFKGRHAFTHVSK